MSTFMLAVVEEVAEKVIPQEVTSERTVEQNGDCPVLACLVVTSKFEVFPTRHGRLVVLIWSLVKWLILLTLFRSCLQSFELLDLSAG